MVEPMSSAFTPEQWAAYLEADRIGEEEMELRKNMYAGPAGGLARIQRVGGRPRKSVPMAATTCLAELTGLFDAE